MKLCFGFLPATAVAATSSRRCFLKAAHHIFDSGVYSNNRVHRYRSKTATATRTLYPAFGWTSRGQDTAGRDTSTGRERLFSSSGGTSGSIAAKTAPPREGALQEFAAASPALLARVVAVASDVDGTLTRTDSTVARRTKDAIKAVLNSEVWFFPATGKTRAGMYKILGEEIEAELKAKNAPGVFIQGLVVYSGAGDEILFERLLSADVVAQVEEFCDKNGVSLIAYSGDRIVCPKKDHQTDKIFDYMEPMPEAVGSLTKAMAAGLPIHKLIIMDTTEAIQRLRPVVESVVGEQATFTQALPDMLEVLPPGASKGNGVEVLLQHLGVDPDQLMALGDAENDVDMLRIAGIGTCVGNASPPAKSAAKFVAPTNAEDGAAIAMERLLRIRDNTS